MAKKFLFIFGIFFLCACGRKARMFGDTPRHLAEEQAVVKQVLLEKLYYDPFVSCGLPFPEKFDINNPKNAILVVGDSLFMEGKVFSIRTEILSSNAKEKLCQLDSSFSSVFRSIRQDSIAPVSIGEAVKGHKYGILLEKNAQHLRYDYRDRTRKKKKRVWWVIFPRVFFNKRYDLGFFHESAIDGSSIFIIKKPKANG